MTTNIDKEAIQGEFYEMLLIPEGREQDIANHLKNHPWLLTEKLQGDDPGWLILAAGECGIEVLRSLIDAGCDVNFVNHNNHTALWEAITFENDLAVEFLLDSGADPNLCRSIFGAINRSDGERRKKYVKLMLDHGLDVNQSFPIFGDENTRATALDWAKGHPEVRELLLSHGAKTAAQLAGQTDAE